MEALRWTEKAPIELGYYWVSTKRGILCGMEAN